MPNTIYPHLPCDGGKWVKGDGCPPANPLPQVIVPFMNNVCSYVALTQHKTARSSWRMIYMHRTHNIDGVETLMKYCKTLIITSLLVCTDN